MKHIKKRVLSQIQSFQPKGAKLLTETKSYLAKLTHQQPDLESAAMSHFFSQSLDLFCVAGTDGYFKIVNPAFSKVLGYPIEKLLQEPIVNFVHPDDVAATSQEIEKLAEGHLTIEFENRYRCAGGQYRLIMWNAAPEPSSGVIYACGRDITEQRRRENNQARLFEGLSTSAIIAKTDRAGVITEVNDLFCEISGYSREELIGSTHQIVNSGHHSKAFFQNMWKTIAQGNTWNGDVKNKAKNGSFYWVRTVITPIFSVDQKIESFLAVRFDISQEKTIEEERQFVFQALGLGIWRYNLVTGDLLWDKAMYDLFEVDPSAFSTANEAWEKTVSEGERQRAMEELEAATNEQREYDITLSIDTNKKEKRYIGSRGKILRDISDEPSYLYGVCWDLTELKKNESQLIENESLLTAIVDNIPMALFGKDIKNDLTVCLWNKHAENMFGITAEQFIGKHDRDMFPKEQADFFRKKDLETISNLGVVEIAEEQASTPLGDATLRTKKIVIKDKNNEPHILLGLSEDITEQKRQENEIKMSNHKLATQAVQLNTLFQAMKEGMILQDSHGEILQYNSAATTILNTGNVPHFDKAYLDKQWKKLGGSTKFIDEHPAFIASRTGHPVFGINMEIGSDEHTPRWIRLNAVPFSTQGAREQEDEMCVICTFSDITEEVMLQRTIETERAKATHNAKLASLGEMSAGIAHEINNPLAIISGNTSLLHRHRENPEKFTAKIDTILKSTERIKKIVNGLRKFARSSAENEHKLQPIREVIQEAYGLTENRAHRHHTRLELDINSDSLISCDTVELEQVLINLINNAIDANKDNSDKWVAVKAFDESDCVVLQVIDGGSGISLEAEQKLFQPFFTTKPVGEGTGLGLSITKGILDQHNATIYLNRKSKNTCFEIRFPRVAANTQQAA